MADSQDLFHVDFIYDAIRKVATARGRDGEERSWTLEFVDRDADDVMEVVISGPDSSGERRRLTEDDFTFTDNTVTLAAATTLFMNPIYIRKLRGFTRGNIPTPDIAGPSLP